MTHAHAIMTHQPTSSRKLTQVDLSRDASASTQTHDELALEQHVLQVRDFSLFYGRNQALYDIAMGIPQKKVTALIGPSGCGKSTLLRSMNRLNDLIDSVRIVGDRKSVV